MADVDVEKLRERVERGIEWLVEHDPAGAFHLWFTANLLPSALMPAQSQEVIDAYREYHRQRVRWEDLSRSLGRVDPTWGPEP